MNVVSYGWRYCQAERMGNHRNALKERKRKKATKQKGLANWNVIWNLYFYQNTPNDFIYAFRRAFFSPISVLLPALFVFAFLFHSARFRWSFHFSSMRLELVLFAMPQASRIHFPFIQTNEWRGNILLCFFSVCVSISLPHTRWWIATVTWCLYEFFLLLLWSFACAMV